MGTKYRTEDYIVSSNEQYMALCSLGITMRACAGKSSMAFDGGYCEDGWARHYLIWVSGHLLMRMPCSIR